MKRLISIAVAVFAIGAATPEAKAESVADEVIAMCTRNKANERICEFLARDSNILNLCFLRKNGDLSASRFSVLVAEQLNLKQDRPFGQELFETSQLNCELLTGVKFQ